MKPKPIRLFSRAAMMLLMMLLTATTARAWSGSGTAADPYLISSAEDWTRFANTVSSIEDDGTHGGLVAAVNNNSTLNIEGCVFDGKLLTTNGTDRCAGFVGYRGGTVDITNCLYAPAAPSGSETWVGTSGSATFARNGDEQTTGIVSMEDGRGKMWLAHGSRLTACASMPSPPARACICKVVIP